MNRAETCRGETRASMSKSLQIFTGRTQQWIWISVIPTLAATAAQSG
jgi:hypothetical protein